MKKVTIQIIRLGQQKHDNLFNRLKRSKSKVFKISEIIDINLPNADLPTWGYSDKCISKILNKSSKTEDIDIRIAFIDFPIENNFFTRDLSEVDNYTEICTFYQTDEIFANANVDLFYYMLGIVYKAVLEYKSLGKLNEFKFCHDERRGCLFDMCGIKNDIIYKFSSPLLCYECEAQLKNCAISEDFIVQFKKELKKFKKPRFYRIVDFIKNRPILSAFFALIATIIINLISCLLYDFIKSKI